MAGDAPAGEADAGGRAPLTGAPAGAMGKGRAIAMGFVFLWFFLGGIAP